MRAAGGKVILEAFKPGTAPPDSYSIIGQAAPRARDGDAGGRPGDPQSGRAGSY